MVSAISSGESKITKAIPLICAASNRFGNCIKWILLAGILLLAIGIPAQGGDEVNYFRGNFECHHCGHQAMNVLFVERLKTLAVRMGEPLVIVSGWRCPVWNREVGGVLDGAHTHGLAADVKIRDGHHRFEMVKEAIALGFSRIGIGEHYIHLDSSRRPGHPQEVIWLDRTAHRILEDLAFHA